jgi:EpsI family protein
MNWIRTNSRFLVAIVLLLTTAVFLQARSRRENLPSREPLASFPLELDSWRGTDVPISQDVRDVLGAGDFLLRVYQSSETQPYVDLFVAYFPTQRTGDTIHSPKNCLPGAGWSPVKSGRIPISVPEYKTFMANRYVIAKGDDRQLVLYWYLAHDRAVASEYWAKFYLVADSIKMNRSDGSLVRITTPIVQGEDDETAQQRLISLAAQIVPRLDSYIPR